MNESELSDLFYEDRIDQEVNIGKGATRNVPIREGEEPEFHIETVKCEICHEIIGKCDMSKFEVPMHGSLFIGKDQKHGYPPPFVHDDPWEGLRCPYCRKRPFISPNYFINEKGNKCGMTVECPDCGRGFKNKQGLLGHTTHCKKPIRRN